MLQKLKGNKMQLSEAKKNTFRPREPLLPIGNQPLTMAQVHALLLASGKPLSTG